MMKYTCTVTIHKPRNAVLESFQSKEESFLWVKGLKAFELVEGEENEVNSTYKMVFENKGKTETMMETMTEKSLPDRMTFVYEMGRVWNECINTFTDHGNTTTYTMDVTFRFPLLLSSFIWLFKGIFKKQTLQGMYDLKTHIERKT